MGKYINILFQAVKSKVLDRAKNERPKTDLNLDVFFLAFLSQRSVNSVVWTLERNITHDFKMARIYKIFVIFKVS